MAWGRYTGLLDFVPWPGIKRQHVKGEPGDATRHGVYYSRAVVLAARRPPPGFLLFVSGSVSAYQQGGQARGVVEGEWRVQLGSSAVRVAWTEPRRAGGRERKRVRGGFSARFPATSSGAQRAHMAAGSAVEERRAAPGQQLAKATRLLASPRPLLLLVLVLVARGTDGFVVVRLRTMRACVQFMRI